MDVRERRIALNEALFRDVNENIEKTTRDGRHQDAHFVCECGDPSCEARLVLDMELYRAVRENPLHFIVTPGHEIPDVEAVIERHDRYFLIEKPEHTRPLLDGSSRS